MAFSDSFNESFNKALPVAIAGSMDIVKDQIRKETEKAQKSARLAAIKQAGIQFHDNAIKSGADPKTVGMFTDALAQQSDPDVAAKILNAGLSTSASLSKEAAENEKSQKEIASIGDSIIEGIQPPDLTRLYGKASGIKAYLADKGFDLIKASQDWISTQTLAKSLNGPQQLRLNQALSSVESSIPELLKVSEEFKRTGWTPANEAELKLALTGTDQSKKNIATKYITQINLMKDELAQSFQAGGVPTESGFKLADDILKPAYGVSQLESGAKQLLTNLRLRKNAIANSQPMIINGNNSNEKSSSKKVDLKSIFG